MYKSCAYCGTTFRGPNNKKYCTKECASNAYKEKQRAEYRTSSKCKRETHCRMCGVELPEYKTRFCCMGCKDRYNRLKNGRLSHSEELTRNCIICGKEFKTWRSIQWTCSPECEKVKIRQRSDARLRGKIIDKDITLIKLADKYQGKCQICGEPVDWDDCIEKDGTIICGNMYPSIDHILPISKGGLHSWDNIQLAHRICNCKKSNKAG